jgi:PAS domain S-box-containing protein
VVNRTFLEVNDQLCRMLGYTRDELIGQSARLVYPSEEVFAQVGREKYAQMQQHGVGTVETQWRRKNGDIFPVLLSSSLMHPAHPQEGTTFTVLDLSSRQRAIEQAEASEQRYRQLFESMAEGVVYQDAHGAVLSVNPAAERILGLTLDQLAGRNSTDSRWQAIHEDGTDFPGDQHPAIVALRTGQPVTGVVMGVFNPQRGQHRWLRVSAIPLFHPGETRPFQVFSTFNDFTERFEALCGLEVRE